MFEPHQGRLHEPGEQCLVSPGVEQVVTRVECRQLSDDTNRDGPELGGVSSELWFMSCVTPQERETVWILAGDRQEGAGAETTPGRPAQFDPELVAKMLEDLLEDFSVELLLRIEMSIDDELGHRASCRHVLHGGVGEAGRGERARCTVQDGGSSLATGKQFALDRYTDKCTLARQHR